MIGNKEEYQRMNDVEGIHWWYVSLHKRVIRTITSVFGDKKNLKILDAGCGTGGLLKILLSEGYQNLEGIDLSPDAIDFALRKGLNVSVCDMQDISSEFSATNFDIIVATDVLYFIDKQKRAEVTTKFNCMLKSGGILILNIPAFKIFRGIHDTAVGIQDRQKKSSTILLYDPVLWRKVNCNYWPAIVAPIILVTRIFQQLKMKAGIKSEVVSDLTPPPILINNLLIWIMDYEIKCINNEIFGSSLFVTLQK